MLSLGWNDSFNVEISFSINFRKKFYTESHHYGDVLYVVSFNILVASSDSLSRYRLGGMTVSMWRFHSVKISKGKLAQLSFRIKFQQEILYGISSLRRRAVCCFIQHFGSIIRFPVVLSLVWNDGFMGCWINA